MLNKCGLTDHWDILMNFLDDQLERKIKHVETLTPQKIPLLLLIDNVNTYRGNKLRHHRLFKAYGDNMRNFTVRGLLNPIWKGFMIYCLLERWQLKVSLMLRSLILKT